LFTVAAFLNPGHCPRLQKGHTLQEAFYVMSKNRLPELPVVNEENQVVATVDLFRLVKYLLQFVRAELPIPEDCYQNTMNTIGENEPLHNAAYFPVDRLVVASSGRLRGLLRRADVIRGLMREIEVLRFALDELNLGIAVLSPTGDLLYANRVFRDVAGMEGTDGGLTLIQEVISGVPPFADAERPPVQRYTHRNGTPYLTEYYPVTSGTRRLGTLVKLSPVAQYATFSECFPQAQAEGRDTAQEIQEVFPDVVIKSAKMKEVVGLALKAARAVSSVLITGETGVGKEVIAEIIHRMGSRAHKPLVKVNCAAIPDNLLEAELFGYEKGAFTGAAREGKSGLIEAAHGGTLFLDEITELPLRLQAKLLRFLQNGEFYKLGSARPHRADVRVIAASNCCNISQLTEEGAFRRDLYYRLCVIPLYVPPLRERPEDIIPLALHFLHKYTRAYNVAKKFSPAVLSALQRYPWPGNVRELQHLVERLVIITDDPVIEIGHLPSEFRQSAQSGQKIQITVRELLPLREAYQILEQELLRHALRTRRSARQIAKELGVDHSTVLRKINRLAACTPGG